MDTEPDMISEPAELDQLRRDVAGLTDELAVANLRIVAAIAITPLIKDMVDGDQKIRILATDIVDCWLSLAPPVRQEYDDLAGSTGLASFAGDYSDVIDRDWHPCAGTTDDPDEWTVERMCRLSWQIRIAQILQRQTLHEPPDAAWLEQFPLPAEPDTAVCTGDPKAATDLRLISASRD